MNTLITGGKGLLGSALDFGFKPSKDEVDCLKYDQLSNYIKNNNIDSVVHAAARVGGVKANTDSIATKRRVSSYWRTTSYKLWLCLCKENA
jgi:dTDP-4-dehydrorhamnose reductase